MSLLLSSFYLLPIMSMIFMYKCNENVSKNVALMGSMLTFMSSLLYLLMYDNNTMLYQSMMTSFMGVDWKNLWLIMLTTFLMPITMLISWNYNSSLYFTIMLLMELMCMGMFTMSDMLYFYMLYEAMLMPMFLMMGMWGVSQEKVRAAYSLFFYTLSGSLLLLMAMMYMYMYSGTFNNMLLLELFKMEDTLLFMCFFMSFAVKLPLFPMHLWLPQAHVEAPVAGSVLLAGMLLKLGGYGIISYNLSLFPMMSEYLAPIMWTICMLGIMYTSVITMRQVDMKRMIAYSSVAHMSMVCLGLFNNTSVLGSYMMMMAHGMVSPGLFMMMGFMYESLHTRNMSYVSGLTTTMPLWSVMMFMLMLANMGTPPTMNYMGEFLMTLNLFSNNKVVTMLSLTSMVLSAAYSLYLYNRMAFGKVSEYMTSGPRDLSRMEFNSILPMMLALMWLSFNVNLMMNCTPMTP